MPPRTLPAVVRGGTLPTPTPHQYKDEQHREADLRHAEGGTADDAGDVSLIADVLRRRFSDATPDLVEDVRRRSRAGSDSFAADSAVEGYALFGLRLLTHYRARR